MAEETGICELLFDSHTEQLTTPCSRIIALSLTVVLKKMTCI